jgi:O-acetyl-ADP-ribose deacetylase
MGPTRSFEVIRPGRASGWIELRQGNITAVSADAIVNAANGALLAGGGVDGAIHRAAGPELQTELRARYYGCPTGRAVITGPGRLADNGVRWLVHAVGPKWYGGERGEEELLRSAYTAAMKLADDAGARTIALPAISTGAYRYPLELAAAVGLNAVLDALGAARSIDRAIFVLFDEGTYGVFERSLGA